MLLVQGPSVALSSDTFFVASNIMTHHFVSITLGQDLETRNVGMRYDCTRLFLSYKGQLASIFSGNIRILSLTFFQLPLEIGLYFVYPVIGIVLYVELILLIQRLELLFKKQESIFSPQSLCRIYTRKIIIFVYNS